MNISLSNNTKSVFSSLNLGEIFILNETDVCLKVDLDAEWCVWNTWNFRAKSPQLTDNDTEVTIPKEVNMEVII
nr:MAG TPA: hypothetical protein [Bacteriophage sp.]